jgi:SNF2 family DNA or RNA helicase
VFLLDPWWNPAVEGQAIDRTHRIGQTRKVFAYRLIAKDTVEERVAMLQEEKRRLVDAVLAGGSGGLRGLSVQDVARLLE